MSTNTEQAKAMLLQALALLGVDLAAERPGRIERTERLLRLPEVKRMTGLGETSIYELARAGRFPQRVALIPGNQKAVAWRESEIQEWVAQRPAAAH